MSWFLCHLRGPRQVARRWGLNSATGHLVANLGRVHQNNLILVYSQPTFDLSYSPSETTKGRARPTRALSSESWPEQLQATISAPQHSHQVRVKDDEIRCSVDYRC